MTQEGPSIDPITPKDTLFLHIGLPKTGSTSIQAFLRHNAAVLSERYGVGYPPELHAGRARRIQAYAQYPEIGSTTRRKLGALLDDEERFVADFQDAVHRAIDESNCTRFVLSSELASRLDARQVARLRELLEGRFERFVVVMYIRRQDRLELSAYLQAFKGGYTGASFSQPFVARRPSTRSVIENWSSAFGEEAMKIRIYERGRFPGHDVVRDFLTVLGIHETNEFSWTSEKNHTWGTRQIALADVLNRLVPPERLVGTRRRRWPASFVAFIDRFDRGPPFLPARHEAREFCQSFSEENEWIRAHFFPDQATLFDESFDRYPLEPAEFELTKAELERALAELWVFFREEQERLEREHAEQVQALESRLRHLEVRSVTRPLLQLRRRLRGLESRVRSGKLR